MQQITIGHDCSAYYKQLNTFRIHFFSFFQRVVAGLPRVAAKRRAFPPRGVYPFPRGPGPTCDNSCRRFGPREGTDVVLLKKVIHAIIYVSLSLYTLSLSIYIYIYISISIYLSLYIYIQF